MHGFECYEQGVGTKRDLRMALEEYGLAKDHEVYGAPEAVERVLELIRREGENGEGDC